MWCVCICVCAASICPSKQSWQTNLMWPRKGQPHSNCLSLTLGTASPSLLPIFSFFSPPSSFPHHSFRFFNFNSTSFSLATFVYFSRLVIITISLPPPPPPTVTSHPVSGAPDLKRQAGSKDSSGGATGRIGQSSDPCDIQLP